MIALVLLALPVGGGPVLAQGGLRLPGLSGGELETSELEASEAVVFVWASWSPRCRDIDRQINAAENRWGSRARVVSVSFQEEAGAVEAFLEGKELRVATYLDPTGAFAKKHAVTTLPSLLVFHRGKVAFRGSVPADVGRVIDESLGAP